MQLLQSGTQHCRHQLRDRSSRWCSLWLAAQMVKTCSGSGTAGQRVQPKTRPRARRPSAVAAIHPRGQREAWRRNPQCSVPNPAATTEPAPSTAGWWDSSSSGPPHRQQDRRTVDATERVSRILTELKQQPRLQRVGASSLSACVTATSINRSRNGSRCGLCRQRVIEGTQKAHTPRRDVIQRRS